jgi:hypothetical protein
MINKFDLKLLMKKERRKNKVPSDILEHQRGTSEGVSYHHYSVGTGGGRRTGGASVRNAAPRAIGDRVD